MEIAKIVLLVLHFIGIASLLGSFLVQIKDIRRGEGRILAGMFHGALTMLVTGLALVALAEIGVGPVNHAKIAVKLLVLVGILALVFRKRERTPAWVLWAIGGLSVANIVLAVAW